MDNGASRASRIPVSLNMPGFPDGVAGPWLLGRMRTQALRTGAQVVPGDVERLGVLSDGGFKAKVKRRNFETARMLLVIRRPGC